MGLPESLWRDSAATAVGAAAGAAAFVAGFVATFLVQRDELGDSERVADEIAAAVDPSLADAAGNLADWLRPDAVEAVGWFFFASHRVALDVSVAALGQSARFSANLRQTPLWDGNLALVPPVVLFVTGFLLARVAASDESALASGVRIAVGYALAALVAVSVVTYTRDAGFAAVTIGPPLATALAYCATYAVVFGTLGAMLAAVYGDGGGHSSTTA